MKILIYEYMKKNQSPDIRIYEKMKVRIYEYMNNESPDIGIYENMKLRIYEYKKI